MPVELTPEQVLRGYQQGIFPMADGCGRIEFYAADPRAIIDPQTFHVPRTLRQLYRQQRFELAVNRDFPAVLSACANRPEGTWISTEIARVYTELHELGFAHSVEAYQGSALAGGLYGISFGGAFFGESMFHRVPNASKVALVYLVERMNRRGLALLDVQFMTDHLRQFGTIEIAHEEYMERLTAALRLPCRFA
ncbi:MAG: leucyl/phenylalanyl-tRNA--protein transferase [Phycisphaerae bacterium]|nr:leucyl/phenylalanyl-tRNA--protein transferase [Phycisphaerae bacterium]